MEPLDIILIGCGMMGARHLRGYAELESVLPGSLRLRAVCDPNPEAAERVVAEAEQLLGYRPRACACAEEALATEPGIVAADLVTDNRSHDAIAIPLLEAGLHVQVEKPIAITIPRAWAMIHAAKRCGRILAVAENNRRDPMNRLFRHLIDAGLIGRPYFLQQTSIWPESGILATPWRHSWAMGGLAMDVGIHFAYIMESFFGPIHSIVGNCQRVLDQRLWTPPGGVPEWVPVASPDIFTATLAFACGAQGAWTMHFAGAGEGQWQRKVFGAEGSLDGPGDRSGGPVTLTRNGASITGPDLLLEAPDYALSHAETLLFGDRPTGYSFDGAVTDRKLLAAELANFLGAIRGDERAETHGEVGIRAVAVIYALLESCLTGQSVRVEDVLLGKSGLVAQEKVETATL